MWPDLRSTSALVGLVAGEGIQVQIYCNFHLNPLIRKRKLSPLGLWTANRYLQRPDRDLHRDPGSPQPDALL